MLVVKWLRFACCIDGTRSFDQAARPIRQGCDVADMTTPILNTTLSQGPSNFGIATLARLAASWRVPLSVLALCALPWTSSFRSACGECAHLWDVCSGLQPPVRIHGVVVVRACRILRRGRLPHWHVDCALRCQLACRARKRGCRVIGPGGGHRRAIDRHAGHLLLYGDAGARATRLLRGIASIILDGR